MHAARLRGACERVATTRPIICGAETYVLDLCQARARHGARQTGWHHPHPPTDGRSANDSHEGGSAYASRQKVNPET